MFNQVVPNDNESKLKIIHLKIFSILFLILGLMKLLDSEVTIIKDLICSLILFIAFYKMSYWLIVFFILFAIFNIIYYINFFGVLITNNTIELQYLFIVKLLTLSTYIISLYYTFLAYKCFKKKVYFGNTNNDNLNSQNNANNFGNANFNSHSEENNNDKFKPFTGNGIKL